MNTMKNKKGFSMAELLLALLVISIVLSASMPTVVRGAKDDREKIWHWINANSAVYFGKNSAQKVLLGIAETPTYDIVNAPEGETPPLNAKVSVVKPQGMGTSHFDIIYTVSGTQYYGARIAADSTNLAFGTRVLQNNSTGINNTGIGSDVLGSNTTGSNNTAIGDAALYSNNAGNSNTVVGSSAGYNITTGSDNTIVGYNAGYNSLSATDSSAAPGIKTGSKNTIIGSNACSNLPEKATGNICIGYKPTENIVFNDSNSNNRLFIGTNTRTNYKPLISGHTDYDTSIAVPYDKDIKFFARNFNIRTFDGERPIFTFGQPASWDHGSHYRNQIRLYIDSSSSYKEKTYTGIYSTGYTLYIKTYKNDNSKDDEPSDDFPSININDALKITVKNQTSPTYHKYKYENVFETPVAMTIRSGNTTDGISKMLLNSSGLNLSTTRTDTDTNPFMVESDTGLVISSSNGALYTGAKNISFETDASSGVNNKMFFHVPKKDGTSINLIASKLILGTPSGYLNKGEIDAVNLSLSLKNSGGTERININGTDGKIKTDVLKIGALTSNPFISSNSDIDILINEYDNALSDANTYCTAARVCYYYSDLRLKNVSGDNVAGLDEISKLQVKNFTYKNDKKKEPHVGVIAQDLQKIFPNSVSKDPEGFLMINAEEMFYATINAVKQLFVKIQDLTARAAGLDERLNKLEQDNMQLKAKNVQYKQDLKRLESYKLPSE